MSETMDIVKELLSNRGGKIFSGLTAVFTAFLLLHASFFWSYGVDLVDKESFVHTWEITFTESVASSAETTLIGDEETYDYAYTSERSTLDERMVAAFRITVSYTESSGGAGNPCDSVTASIKPSEMQAQWTNDSTQVSGNSDDCSDIVLTLLVYPDYPGQPVDERGVKEEDVLSTWQIQDYGVGNLVCQVSVDTTDGPTSSLPLTGSDEGEEVTVTWERIEFTPSASRVD